MFKRLGTIFVCVLALAFAAACSSNDKPAHRTATTATPTAHDIEARRIVAKLVARDFIGVRSNFDARMLNELPPARLQAGWDHATGALGAFKQIASIRHTTTFADQSQPADVELVVVVFEKGSVDVETAFVAGQVAGLYLKPHLP